jgi:hypothetical protein
MKTKKHYIKKNNNTKKNCNKVQRILEPFEKKYEKGLKPSLIKTHNSRINNLKKMFDQINSYGSLQPKDDFYSFTNSKWYKNIKLTQLQSYITEIDDFRLVQFKV